MLSETYESHRRKRQEEFVEGLVGFAQALIKMTELHGFSAEAAFAKKFEINKGREWNTATLNENLKND